MSGDSNGGVPAGAFEPTPSGERWVFRGSLTFDNALAVVEATSRLPLPTGNVVGLEGLDNADSSALAVLFALKRRARAERRTLRFEAPPEGVAALARVYGVDALLFA